MSEEKKFSLPGVVQAGSKGFVKGLGTLLIGAAVVAKAVGKGAVEGYRETKAMTKADLGEEKE